MKLLAVCAHPSPDSLHGAIRRTVLERLADSGHRITTIDLYEEAFDPVLPIEEWALHSQGEGLVDPVADQVARLRAAEGLIFIYPTWWYGMPAMLKGWLDRVWQPGVAFTMDETGALRRHRLTNVRRFAAITTHGSPAWFIKLYMGDPGRRQVMRGLTPCLAGGCRTSWHACHDVDRRPRAALRAWTDRTAGRLEQFFRA
ncbi:NAD(P)H-dependent oxidoreductase [Caulobacter mirabilis]|uniref:NAD(P)H dehydrogenase n=1 Tax=Caulobacter mirabilis TaxID=69666 RepID=A0A2D2AZG9_9CAUL|nr:NAD(P)H-dependent oxidoreductase [Caulobacter mirabilis]ATQ43392.1 NAD(P)H dehydrogenase [Caulobacter mirabilis]